MVDELPAQGAGAPLDWHVLSRMEPPAVEGDDRAARAPGADASRFRVVCIAQVFNEIRKGNLQRFFEHVAPLVDAVVVYDDGSTDGSYEYLLAHTPHVIRSARNDFADEVHHKQILLEAALRLNPDFILSLDADEVLTTEDPEDIQRLCAWVVARDLDGAELHEINLWRSHSWRRIDSLFDDGWFVRLWRVTPGMGFMTSNRGLHQLQFPSSVQKVDHYPGLRVLHYGFADWGNLAHKYLVYRAHGQRGYDMLDRLVSDEQLVLKRVPEAEFPLDLRGDEPAPAPLAFAQSLAEVERRRDDVFRPGFSIVCSVFKSVDWLRFCYEQVLRYTDMRHKELLFVANDASDEVLEYLRANYIPHVEWNNTAEQRTEWYVNNIYRAYNYGAKEARGDFLLFINTDMGFSPGWFEALWEAYDGSSAVASRLVESGKVRSGPYGVEMDFGSTPSSYREQDFVDFADSIRESTVMDGGLHMPLLLRRDTFLSVGGFPEGNMPVGCDIFDPAVVIPGKPRPEAPCISGDTVAMQRLLTKRVRHRTACDSVVYHVQMGEKDTPVDGPAAIPARPLVAVLDSPADSLTSGTGLWETLRGSLPLAVGRGSLADAADAAIIIQDASSAVAVDPDRYVIAYLREDPGANDGDASHQERNLRAARFAVADSLRTAMSYPEYEFEIIPAAADDEANDAVTKWRVLLERAMQEVTVERIGFVGPQSMDEGGGAAPRKRTPRRSGYAPIPQAPPLPEPDPEHAAGLMMEEQAVRLRRRVEKAVGPRFADPTLRAIHAVSWTVRPLRHRLARIRTRFTADQ